MRISSSNVRPKRRALRRATAGAIAISPRYEAKELGGAGEGKDSRPLRRRRELHGLLRFPSFSSAGNDSTSVGPRLPRYSRFHLAISASVTRQTVNESPGKCNSLCARAMNLSRGFKGTLIRRWRFKIIGPRAVSSIGKIATCTWPAANGVQLLPRAFFTAPRLARGGPPCFRAPRCSPGASSRSA